MIASFHVASGAAGGAVAGSRGRAVVLGAVLHALGDRVPHGDIPSHRFETVSAAAGVLLLAIRCGPLDPATLGAVASSAPDLEHIVRLPRPGGRKLFPSHRIRGFHRTGGIGPRAQLLAAGLLLGLVLGARRPRGA